MIFVLPNSDHHRLSLSELIYQAWLVVVAAVGVQEDLLAAEVDLGEEVMIEAEDMIVDMPLEADIAEDIVVDLGATLHTEISKRRQDGHWHHSNAYEQDDRSMRKVTGPDADESIDLQERDLGTEKQWQSILLRGMSCDCGKVSRGTKETPFLCSVGTCSAKIVWIT